LRILSIASIFRTQQYFSERSRGSIPGMGKIFVSSPQRSHTGAGAHQPPLQWVPEFLFSGIKRPGREVDHSPPSNAEVKNGGAIPPFLHTRSGVVFSSTRTLPFFFFSYVSETGVASVLP
jgi:hypothetical protein